MTLKSFNNPDSDEARQFLLDRRSERPHPKRHRTLKRRKALSAQKRARIKHKLGVMKAERGKYLLAAREYWAGTSDGHP